MYVEYDMVSIYLHTRWYIMSWQMPIRKYVFAPVDLVDTMNFQLHHMSATSDKLLRNNGLNKGDHKMDEPFLVCSCLGTALKGGVNYARHRLPRLFLYLTLPPVYNTLWQRTSLTVPFFFYMIQRIFLFRIYFRVYLLNYLGISFSMSNNTSLTTTAKLLRRRWIRHIERLDEEMVPRRLTKGQVPGRSSNRRPRIRGKTVSERM